MHDKPNSTKSKTQHYLNSKPMTDNQVLEAAAEILACKYVKKDSFTSNKRSELQNK